MKTQCFNNGQLEPENNPVCTILVKDSKNCTNIESCDNCKSCSLV